MTFESGTSRTGEPNGASMAAILAAGIGAFAMGAIVLLHEAKVFSAPSLYAPAGGVSGRTALAVVVWLLAWLLAHRTWRARRVDAGRVFALTLLLVLLGLIATFPPTWRILGG
jgi:hypothetical protein